MPKYFDFVFQSKIYMKQFFVMSPRHRRFDFLIWKRKNKDLFTPEMREALAEPNLRCLECGCKYNFAKSTFCPRCKSDKSNLLEDESLFSDPLVLVSIGLLAVPVSILTRIFH
jgi:hypothetical protein